MARNGIAPLSTIMALAFTSGSSTTSQRPRPKKTTSPISNAATPTVMRMHHARERGLEFTAGLSGVAIWGTAHAIPPRRSGQSMDEQTKEYPAAMLSAHVKKDSRPPPTYFQTG